MWLTLTLYWVYLSTVALFGGESLNGVFPLGKVVSFCARLGYLGSFREKCSVYCLVKIALCNRFAKWLPGLRLIIAEGAFNIRASLKYSGPPTKHRLCDRLELTRIIARALNPVFEFCLLLRIVLNYLLGLSLLEGHLGELLTLSVLLIVKWFFVFCTKAKVLEAFFEFLTDKEFFVCPEGLIDATCRPSIQYFSPRNRRRLKERIDGAWSSPGFAQLYVALQFSGGP